MAEKISVRYWDSHFHGRLKPIMDIVLPQKAARACGGALEPNTKDPHLTTYDQVLRYLDDAYRIAPERSWKASIYLTAEPRHKDILRLWDEGHITHIKHYPPGGSTHTDESPYPYIVLDKNSEPGKLMLMASECGLPLKRHAEDSDESDPYNRERADLMDTELRFMETYPELRRILAHVSTEEAVRHMLEYGDPDKYICEITAHHLVLDRSALYDGGALLPDHHCLPVIKSRRHWRALRKLLEEMLLYVNAGSDGAGHLTKSKYRFDAFGGLYTYHCDLELYVQTLAELGLLEYADAFLYGNAKRFHGRLVPDDPEPVTLEQKSWTVTDRIPVPWEDDEMTPFGYHPDPKKRFVFKYQLAS